MVTVVTMVTMVTVVTSLVVTSLYYYFLIL